jgi:hypothetical protein
LSFLNVLKNLDTGELSGMDGPFLDATGIDGFGNILRRERKRSGLKNERHDNQARGQNYSHE